MRHSTILVLLCLTDMLIPGEPVAASALSTALVISQAANIRQAPLSTDDTDTDTDNTETPASEDSREKAAFDRSLVLLRKQPRPGTALDRVLQYHEDRDTLPEFINGLKTTPARSNDTSAAAIRGMAEAFRGNYPEARDALQLAESQRPNDPVISWLLGQTCLKLNDPSSAADALQRALAKKPASADLLRIAKDLSLALGKAGKAEQIPAMWKSVEALSGRSERIAEQIAMMLRSDGQLPEAIQRFEALSRHHSDPWKATAFAITAADLKIQSGLNEAALRDLQTVLASLATDSVQARQIRSRIEDLFRRSGDLVALSTWYQTHLAEFPEDTEAVQRFAELLVRRQQPEEADRLLRDALRQSPSTLSLRRALIHQQHAQKRFHEALALYQQLERDQLAEAEDLEAWGQLCLQIPDQPVEQRQAAAALVWKKLLKGHENEAAQLCRTAALLQSVAAPQDVIELYESAIRLEPDHNGSRELLGEFLWSRGRFNEALTVWRSIAATSRRSENTLREVSEILARHGQAKEAIETLREACGETPDFEDILTLCQMMREYQEGATRPFVTEALQLLSQAETLCESDQDQQRVLQEKVLTLQSSGQLSNRIRILQQALSNTAGSVADSITQPHAERWLELATICHAADRSAEAIAAVTEAVRVAPDSIPALRLAADIYQKNGRLADAVRLKRLLLERDPRSRVLHLRSLAELEMELGNRDGAVKAAKDFASATVNSLESSAFSARILMQAGQSRDALRILKRIVTASPEDADACMEFVAALIDAHQTEEAADVAWQLLERTQDEELRLRLIPTLAELTRQSGRSQELPARLEALLADEDADATRLRCLGAAWLALGNSTAARAAMQQLAASGAALPEDQLRLAELCLAEQDAPAALQYLNSLRLEQLSPTVRNQAEELLLNAAVANGSTERLSALVRSQWTVAESLSAIDQLLAEDAVAAAASLSRELTLNNPENRPARIRLAVSEWRCGNQPLAVTAFQQFLDAEPARETETPATTPSALGNPTTDAPDTPQTTSNALPIDSHNAMEIPDILRWEQLSVNSHRILLASSRMSVLDFRSVLDSWTNGTALALQALAEDASQRGQLSALFDTLQQRAAGSPAAAWHLWMLRRLWGAGQGASWNSAADSLRLFQHGHPRGAAAVLADIQFLYGMPLPQRMDDKRPDVGGLEHSSMLPAPEALSDADLTLVLQAFVKGSPDLSAAQLSRISAAIAQAIRLGSPELRTTAETLLNSTLQQASPYERLLSQRLSADLAAAFEEDGPSLSELMTILKPVVPSASEVSDRERQGAEVMVLLMTEQLAANSSPLSAKTLTDVLDWWVQLRAANAVPSQSLPNSGSLSLVEFRPETFRKTKLLSLPLSEFLTPADHRFLNQALTSGAHLSPDLAPISAQWKAAIPNRPAAEHIAATLALTVIARLSTADVQLVQRDVADLLARFAPESLPVKIWQIAQRESAGQYAAALGILDSLPDNDPGLFRVRELRALQLAAFADENQRALLAASRLSGMQLSVAEQVELLRGLRLAGLHEEYTSAVSRLFPSDLSITPQRQMEQLNLLVAQGQQAEAIQLATDILNRPAMNSGARFRRTGKVTSDDLRKRAADVLTLFPPTATVSSTASATGTEKTTAEAKPDAGQASASPRPDNVASGSGIASNAGPAANAGTSPSSAPRTQSVTNPQESGVASAAATVPQSSTTIAAKTWIENWRVMRASVDELRSSPEIILPVLKRLSEEERRAPEFLPIWVDCAIPWDAPEPGKSLFYRCTEVAEPRTEADDAPTVAVWRTLLQQTSDSLVQSQVLQKLEEALRQWPAWSDGHVFRACLLARQQPHDEFQNTLVSLSRTAGTSASAAALALLAETIPDSLQSQRQCLELLHAALSREQQMGWLFLSPMSAAWRKLCLLCNEPHRITEIAASRWRSGQAPPVATVKFQIQAAFWLLEHSCPLDALRLLSLLQEQDVVRYHTFRAANPAADVDPTMSLSSLQLQAAQFISVEMLRREFPKPGSGEANGARRLPILLTLTASGNSAANGNSENLPECLILHRIAETARVSPPADLVGFADEWSRLLQRPQADEFAVAAGSMVLLSCGEAAIRDVAAEALRNWLMRAESAESVATVGREELAAIALSAAWALDHSRNQPSSEVFLQWTLQQARAARLPELETALTTRQRQRLLDANDRTAAETFLSQELQSILRPLPQP